MRAPEIVRFSDREALARGAAARWVDRLAVLGEAPCCLAVSGGRIAGGLFQEAARLVRERRVSLAGVEFFFADERCVPPMHPESNFALAKAALFDSAGIRPERIHRIRGELEPEAAALEAEAELCRVAPRSSDGQPVLDLALLGMGEDGHIASLFPAEAEELTVSPRVYRPVIGPKPPPRRVTLGFRPLVAAKEVWVIVSGEGKSAALRTSLEPGGATPLGRLLGLRQRTTLLTDVPV